MVKKRVLFEKTKFSPHRFPDEFPFFPEDEDFPLFLIDPYLVCICIHPLCSIISIPLIHYVHDPGADFPFSIEGILLAFGKKKY